MNRQRVASLIAVLLFVRVLGFGQYGATASLDPIRDILGFVSQNEVQGTIQGLQDFRTRYWNNANRDSIARWIRARFLSYGITDVVIDSFQYSGTVQYNVVATLAGTGVPSREIVLGAHTDSRSPDPLNAPGADDNASGVSAIVEIARVLVASGYQPASTMRFIGYGAEEVGLVGSAAYATLAVSRNQPITAMLNFDMIGYRPAPKVGNEFFLVWYVGGEDLARTDSAMARQYTSLTPVLTTSSRSGSDSYSFAGRGYPAVFHFEQTFNPSYHSALDLLESIDLPYCVEIIKSGLATALRVDGVPAAVMREPYQPTQFALSQNYPNPFNAGTTVTYEVPQAGHARVEVFDLLGRSVAVLADGWHDPGRFVIRWEPVPAATGIYFARLTWGAGGATIRMLSVR